jgi:hypothetical protein
MNIEKAALRYPEVLQLRDAQGISYGANQSWYDETIKKRAGCGPTVFAHICWYLGLTRPDCRGLLPFALTADALPGEARVLLLQLMEETWHYITPGRMGVNRPYMFTGGAERYGRDKNVPLVCDSLEISPARRFRPTEAELGDFLLRSLAADLPVAFLNLSNGALPNLDNWHWVTLVAYDATNLSAIMYDQCQRVRIDLGLWLRTTMLGGGFVSVRT